MSTKYNDGSSVNYLQCISDPCNVLMANIGSMEVMMPGINKVMKKSLVGYFDIKVFQFGKEIGNNFFCINYNKRDINNTKIAHGNGTIK
jgi:hypothetical protein